ncbi:precorrin-2 dehydrogenase/sirohydrochlorin ferrochelatase family protein [Flavilitoribacter nigricans]|uniref:precorrin-2 dehydrogenase n=1 Tax=Flavilitoribacter nigricans (strain ATCC 23147 / DSM 23189 / NBRC 102662 / NCIMB 1420 / SS-2) TaxID=1122177 RepID=A0A2D0N629_FLAN2|nr:bifunctional precorrin-2 dehydrogenase/sirohydrochlorin ferrochelatase [Flavilitoribacter nigricans]PHN03961.1 siroheme synthase [Flavilitoribacter nigricans DSM 23189 = NBRC 102662]
MTDFNDNNTGNTLFPVFLKLHQLHLLIVGGGNVGLEKLEAVLKSSPVARVTLVAGEIRRPEILEIAKNHPNLEVIIRPFQMDDLDGKDVVILATDSRPLHATIKTETRKRHLLTNVADTPDLCDFYLCSVVKKGDMKIGVSTNGKSPTLAKRMREYLTESLPDSDSMQTLLDNLKEVRDKLGGDFDYKVQKLNEITSSWLEERKD